MAINKFNMCNTWKTMPNSWTITIKQNVQFFGKDVPLDQIKNGRLAAMRNIWKTMPDSYRKPLP